MSLLSKWFRRSDPWDRNNPLVTFGRNDSITIGAAYENIAILGGVGSGKTTGSGSAICRAMLGCGMAGMVLTAKRGEADRWRRLCAQAGRLDDLIVIDDKSDWQFNFLDYQLSLQGRSCGAIENLVMLLDTTIKVAERATGMKPGNGQEAFWEQGIRKHARSVITLVVYATGSVSVANLLEIMRDVPRSLEQANDSKWRQASLIEQLLHVARQRCQDPLATHDLDQVESYFFREFPSIAERTRSVFEAGLYGILDLVSRGQLHWMFGRSTNITPAACFDGKILVIDLPTSTHRAIGMIAQTLFKLAFQRTVEQRQPDQQRPLFLVADEFQELLTLDDFRFAAISRECKVVNLWLTQSIASLYAVLGADESGKAACDAILGLANYKIMHSNSCPITNQWAADLIGRRRKMMHSLTLNHPTYQRILDVIPEEPGYSSTSSESFEYAVMPHEFSSLRKGGPPQMLTEAILFGGGRRWHGSRGESYLRVSFNQGF